MAAIIACRAIKLTAPLACQLTPVEPALTLPTLAARPVSAAPNFLIAYYAVVVLIA